MWIHRALSQREHQSSFDRAGRGPSDSHLKQEKARLLEDKQKSTPPRPPNPIDGQDVKMAKC